MGYASSIVENRAVEAIGGRIRRRRKELGLSQERLASAAGSNQGYLSQIERGRANPRQRTIDALAVALNLPQGVLIGGGSEHDTPQPWETRELPLFGTIPAGPPSESQEQLEMFPVLRHQCARNCFCLKLSLDSMEPTLKRVTVEWREGRRLVILRGDNPRIAPLLIDRSRDFSIQGVVVRLVCREL